MINVNDIWMEFHLMFSKNKYCYMQRDENLVCINNGVNGQQIDGHSHGLPSDRCGLHPPIWFSPDLARSAPDQCQN